MFVVKYHCFLKLFSSLEMRGGEKCFKLICLYRFQSHTHDECENSLNNFHLNLDTIREIDQFMNSITDDFDARSNSSCKNDIISL